MQIDITSEEFYEMMNRLYPDQTARALAELRAAKLQQLVEEMRASKEIDDADGE